MFSEKKKNGNSQISKQPNRFGSSTDLKGDIVSQEDFRIDGTFEGNFETTGKLVVGPSGKLSGTIKAGHAEVMGEISGDLIVKELLSIKSSAKIEGNVKTGKLSVEQGATFNATCEMTSAKTVKVESGQKAS
jgi:cytoskeletal protein CcmA (bactofilin family)